MAIITIGGNVGAGKTTLAGKLAAALHYEELYMGGVFREMAAEHGMTIQEFYATLKNDPALERSTDERQAKFMREKDNTVVQGRVAWFFAKQSPFTIFNVFLAVEPATGAARAAQRKENAGQTVAEIAQINVFREKSEREHYATLYEIENFLDHKYYDFVLDTSHLTEDEVLKKILEKIKRTTK